MVCYNSPDHMWKQHAFTKSSVWFCMASAGRLGFMGVWFSSKIGSLYTAHNSCKHTNANAIHLENIIDISPKSIF